MNSFNLNPQALANGIYNQGLNAYQYSENLYGTTPNAAFNSQLNPRKMPGLSNYAGAGIAGVGEFVGNANSGMGIGENITRTTGRTAGTFAGGAGGAAIGTAVAPALAAVPVAGPVLAAASPFVGQMVGSMIGGDVGEAGTSGVWNALNGGNSISISDQNTEALGKYSEYLTPDQRQSLNNYLALTEAQNAIDRDNALFSDDIARARFREAAAIDFNNQAALAALNNRAQMEQADRMAQYQLAGQGSNNMFNAISSGMNSMAGLYAA